MQYQALSDVFICNTHWCPSMASWGFSNAYLYYTITCSCLADASALTLISSTISKLFSSSALDEIPEMLCHEVPFAIPQK
ncbi:hypothetical protein KIN20_003022 [Parelaphostrongylus tenuis]|uniref:Uncharacterized protein n=1 Tax=Parelaphostrongylus tenuis TaxID=148309 RepID=A0AAD5QFS2_PARTN|nr:hypothetical protein KIN20_003022 [Parelaphostrongylus tenuis]